MRKFKFIALIVMVLIVGALTVFTSTSSISFIGKDKESGIDVALDSVYVLNKTQSLDTTLILTTSLDLEIFTGLEENNHANQVGFSISQNYPNAFECQTQFTVYLPKQGKLAVSVFNLVGQKILTSANQYSAGFHSFSLEGANLSNGTYIISASNGEETKSIKIIKLGTRSGQGNLIKYQGQADSENHSLSKKAIFNPGDTYLFVGYAAGYIKATLDNQMPSKLKVYVFDFERERVTLYGQFTDPRDGVVYKTIKIGFQTWMAENLKATKYRNGEAIPNVTDNKAWAWAGAGGTAYPSGARCSYDNNEGNVATYGWLYNWLAAGDARKIAPEGWHVPSKEEFDILLTYCGGEGTNHNSPAYQSLIPGGSSRFNALLGGFRYFGGGFSNLNTNSIYWSASQSFGGATAWYLNIDSIFERAHVSDLDKGCGFSVRCVKDN